MALALIGTPVRRRTDRGVRVSGQAQFTTTSLTGELPIDSDGNNLKSINVNMLSGPSNYLQLQLGAIAATRPFRILVPWAGIITRVRVWGDATSAAHASNILNWHIINLSTGAGTAVVVDRADSSGANTTDTDIGASATALTAEVAKTLTLTATTADKTVAAGDILNFAWTVTGGTAQTAAGIDITLSADGSTGDEYVWVDERALVNTTNGYLAPVISTSITPNGKSVTVNRSGVNPKSGAIFSFNYEF